MNKANSLTVVIQYVGHVINAGGCVTYRSVEIKLTPDQMKLLELSTDEYYGPVSFSIEPKVAESRRGIWKVNQEKILKTGFAKNISGQMTP